MQQVEKKFSRYKIEAELGHGGMATVYRAYDPLFDRKVALKILKRDPDDDSKARERFEREVKIVARLEHAAIVPVYDVGKDNDDLFFVMRYMPGGSLADLMADGPLSLPEAAHVVQRIAAALDYAHSKGVIHRDIKPGNILFDEDGDAYISDFGNAKFSDAPSKLTVAGIIGTPTYMSPEQALAEHVDGRSDIYSLGVLLFEMLTGKPPFQAATQMAVALKHINDPIPNILEINPSLPPGLKPALEKALMKNRQFRYATAAELAHALVELLPAYTAEQAQPMPVRPRLIKTVSLVPKITLRQRLLGNRWLIGGLILPLLLIATLLGGRLVFAGAPAPVTSTPTADFSATPALPAPTSAPSLTAAPSFTLTATSQPTATPQPSLTPSETPVPPIETGLGGADKIALLANNDIYTMDVDGSNLFQLTNDDKTKLDLQWLPGGQELLYIQAGCVNIVNIETQEKSTLTCFDNFSKFEGFRVSPDGSQVAISLDRRLLVVPFNRETLAATHTRYALENLPDLCLVYTAIAAKRAEWSADGQKLAVLFQSAESGKMGDYIRVMDVHRCRDADPLPLAKFPNTEFSPLGYANDPSLPSYGWDGDQRFLLNTFKRNEGYGDLYLYDMDSGLGRKINPVDNTCCYQDASFSPDGKYILFAFQDLRLGQGSETKIYYIPFDAIGTGAIFTPIKVSSLLFDNPREKIQPVLRPVVP